MAAANLVLRTTNPHLLFIALHDGGPPALHWAGRSRSERKSKAQLAIGPTGGDQPNNDGPVHYRRLYDILREALMLELSFNDIDDEALFAESEEPSSFSEACG